MIEPEQNAPVFSVTELNNHAKRLLETSFPNIWLEGEISNLARPRSGHIYLSLKDDNAQLRAAMFRGQAQRVRFPLKDGLQVLVRGKLTLYTPRGDYQLIIEHMEEAGLGALQRAFEQLKQKLQLEGLFAEERKKTVPLRPTTIGVITSPSGAAIHDIVSVLKRRFPLTQVILYPALVQGAEAAKDLVRALETANRRHECDVLIIGRGGGSLEDLWCFNDETLARAIATSSLPTIAAVGHQVDFTIADFVADARAPTPSAAAELLSANGAELAQLLRKIEVQLADKIRRTVTQHQQTLAGLKARLQHPGRRLQEHAQRLDELELRLQQNIQRCLKLLQLQITHCENRLRAQNPLAVIALQRKNLSTLDARLTRTVENLLKNSQTQLNHLAQQLNTVSPLQTLSRGYSITQNADTGSAILSNTELVPGQLIRTRLHQGTILSQVTEAKEIGTKNSQ